MDVAQNKASSRNNSSALGARWPLQTAMYGSGQDANTKTRGEKAIGTTSTLGAWASMLQTNIAVATGARALISILQGTQYSVGAHELCPEPVKAFVNELLFERAKRPFSQYAEDLFKAVLFGFSAMEITTYLADGKLWFKDMDYRAPETFNVNSIKMREDGWVEAEQRYYDSANTLKTVQYGGPGEPGKGWIYWVTFGGNGVLGEALMRPAYALHEEYVDAIIMRRVAGQKCVAGTPTLHVRQGTATDGSGTVTKEAIDNTLAVIAKQRTHENGVILLPDWVESIDNEFTDHAVVSEYTAIINDCITKILILFSSGQLARGLLASFGTNAASESDADQQRNLRRYFLDKLKNWMQPLINYFVNVNFGEQRFYPELQATYVEEMDTTTRVNALNIGKNAGLYKPGKADRDEFRDIMRIAAVEEEEEEIANTPFQPLPPQPPTQDDIEEVESPEDEATTEPPEEMAACHCKRHELAAEGVRLPPRAGGLSPRTGPNGRPLSAIEQLVNWRRIEFTLDTGASAITGVIADDQRLVADYLIRIASESTWETREELAAILQAVKIPASIVKAISKDIRSELVHIADVASDSIRDEYHAQGGQEKASFAASAAQDAAAYADLKAKTLAEKVVSDVRDQVVTFALSIIAKSKPAILDLFKAAKDQLQNELGEKIPPLVTSEVFARARADEVEAIRQETGDVPVEIRYSAILDSNTCEYCEAADAAYGPNGQAIKPGSPEETEYMPPYQKCLGGVRCRCQLIYSW